MKKTLTFFTATLLCALCAGCDPNKTEISHSFMHYCTYENDSTSEISVRFATSNEKNIEPFTISPGESHTVSFVSDILSHCEYVTVSNGKTTIIHTWDNRHGTGSLYNEYSYTRTGENDPHIYWSFSFTDEFFGDTTSSKTRVLTLGSYVVNPDNIMAILCGPDGLSNARGNSGRAA